MRNGNAKRDMSQLSAARKKRKEREALRAKGYKVVQIWLRPREKKAVREFLKQLRTKRRDMSRKARK